MILIPHDMHEWDPDDIQQWLALVADDQDVTPVELRLARRAAARAEAYHPPNVS